MPHALKALTDDVQLGIGQQMMNVGDAPGDRVFDRDHRESGAAFADGREGVLEGAARKRFHVGA